MLLNLKIVNTIHEQQHRVVLTDRLPFFIEAPCEIACHYRLQQEKGYYLLFMEISGQLASVCQRCLARFVDTYTHSAIIALCDTEEIAANLMSEYECVVATNGKVDLDDLILDELHLSAPQKHLDPTQCDPLAMDYLG